MIKFRECRFTTGAFGLGPDRRHVRLPRIGHVRTHESTRRLARKVEAGTARIRSATLSWQRGRWHVAFSVELPDPAPVERTGGRVVGVDLGIKSLAVLSTGQVVSNPRHLDAALTALRRVQRQASRPGPGNPHRRVEPVGQDQGTGGRVAHPRGQCPPRRAAQAVHPPRARARRRGGGGSECKATDAGVRLVVADRWYPSSKTCSACGAVRAKLTLAQRQFVCENCGTRLDRDLNAARNLAALAAQASEPSCGRTKNEPAGNPRKTGMAGNGYRHGKAQLMSQGRLREGATP